MIEKIEVSAVDIQFGDFKVIEGLDFSLSPGVWRIHSSLGGGKSVVLRLLAGTLAPSGGTLKFNETDLSQGSFEEWREFRLKIGYSFDFGGLLNNRSLYDNLLLPLLYHEIFEVDKAHERVSELLEKFELTAVKKKNPSEVTGSQRKALCVARSLIMSPEVLLLDDPTAALKHSVVETLLKEVEEQMTKGNLRIVVYTSDDRRLIEKFDFKDIDCRSVLSKEKVA